MTDNFRDYYKQIRPIIKSITKVFPPHVVDLGESIIGKQCYFELVKEADLGNPNSIPCIKLAISKVLGVGIVSMSSIIKLPQIMKIFSSGSVQGLSLVSFMLETFAHLITTAYNFRTNQPFGTFGETTFLSIQNIIITVLIAIFSKSVNNWVTIRRIFIVLSFFLVILYSLFFQNTSLISDKVMLYLQMITIPLGLASKIPQILKNWGSKSTGQLSGVSVMSSLLGSLARVFTIVQEIKDNTILASSISAVILNSILALQMLNYGNTNEKKRHSKKKTL